MSYLSPAHRYYKARIPQFSRLCAAQDEDASAESGDESDSPMDTSYAEPDIESAGDELDQERSAEAATVAQLMLSEDAEPAIPDDAPAESVSSQGDVRPTAYAVIPAAGTSSDDATSAIVARSPTPPYIEADQKTSHGGQSEAAPVGGPALRGTHMPSAKRAPSTSPHVHDLPSKRVKLEVLASVTQGGDLDTLAMTSASSSGSAIRSPALRSGVRARASADKRAQTEAARWADSSSSGVPVACGVPQRGAKTRQAKAIDAARVAS